MSFAISSFSPSHYLDIWLLTLIKPIHPLLFLLEVLGNIMEGKKLEAKAIGANEALGYLWILIISSIPYPPKSTDHLVSEYINSHEWHKNTSTFQDTFPRAARSCFCLCWCAVPEPQRPAASLAVTVPLSGLGREAVSTDTWRSYTGAHRKRQRERARVKQILGWAQITSHFTSWIKAIALEAYIIYNAQIFQMSTQSWGPPRNREQFDEICTEFTRKFTWYSTFRYQVYLCVYLFAFRNWDSFVYLSSSSQYLLIGPTWTKARPHIPFSSSGIYDYTLFRKKNCGISPFGKYYSKLSI